MSPSLSGAKLLSALVLDAVSVSRRGYAAAAASQAAVASRSGATATGRLGKTAKEEVENAWIPDPVTGYYRPANRPNEVDVAELREIILKQKQ